MFPELNPDKFTRVQGMNMTIVISRRTATTNRARCCAASACRSRPKRQRAKGAAQQNVPGRLTVERQVNPKHRISITRHQTLRHRDINPWPATQKLRKQTEAQVFHASRAAVQAVRPPAGRVSQVRHVPICFRKLADEGLIPGVRKASW